MRSLSEYLQMAVDRVTPGGARPTGASARSQEQTFSAPILKSMLHESGHRRAICGVTRVGDPHVCSK